MDPVIQSYTRLITEFVDGKLDAAAFSGRYLDTFKRETVTLPEQVFDVLDGLFGDADAFTDDRDLLAGNPEFHVDAATLKRRAVEAIDALARFQRR